MGYNQNKGVLIALRLRNDDGDGFRPLEAIRQVMLHELAHIEHSEHDAHFQSLDRELNVSCDAYHKGHVLSQEETHPGFSADGQKLTLKERQMHNFCGNKGR